MDQKDKKDKKPAIGGGLAKLAEASKAKLQQAADRSASTESRNITLACVKAIKNSDFLSRIDAYSQKTYGEKGFVNVRLATFGRESGFLEEIEMAGEHEVYVGILTPEEKAIYDAARDAIEATASNRGGRRPGFQAFREMVFAELQEALAKEGITVLFRNPDANEGQERRRTNNTRLHFSHHWADLNDDSEEGGSFPSQGGGKSNAAKLSNLKAQLDS